MEGLKNLNITTPPLSMNLLSVASPKAMQLTDNLWDATVGSAADKLPEVPPDGTPPATTPAAVRAPGWSAPLVTPDRMTEGSA
jgi:hypothetical protein